MIKMEKFMLHIFYSKNCNPSKKSTFTLNYGCISCFTWHGVGIQKSGYLDLHKCGDDLVWKWYWNFWKINEMTQRVKTGRERRGRPSSFFIHVWNLLRSSHLRRKGKINQWDTGNQEGRVSWKFRAVDVSRQSERLNKTGRWHALRRWTGDVMGDRNMSSVPASGPI